MKRISVIFFITLITCSLNIVKLQNRDIHPGVTDHVQQAEIHKTSVDFSSDNLQKTKKNSQKQAEHYWNDAVLNLQRDDYLQAAEYWRLFQASLNNPYHTHFWIAEFWQGRSFYLEFKKNRSHENLHLLYRALSHYSNFLDSGRSFTGKRLDKEYSCTVQDLQNIGYYFQKHVLPEIENKEASAIFQDSLQAALRLCLQQTAQKYNSSKWDKIQNNLQASANILQQSTFLQEHFKRNNLEKSISSQDILTKLHLAQQHVAIIRYVHQNHSISQIIEVQQIIREVLDLYAEHERPPFRVEENLFSSRETGHRKGPIYSSSSEINKKRLEMEKYFWEERKKQLEKLYDKYRYIPPEQEKYKEGIFDW